MGHEEVPKLADWLEEYRSRPEPVEVVVASFRLVEPVPDHPREGISAGQVSVDIVRIDEPGKPGPPDDSHYVMGANAEGHHLWDIWHESEQAARKAIADGNYGQVVDPPDA